MPPIPSLQGIPIISSAIGVTSTSTAPLIVGSCAPAPASGSSSLATTQSTAVYSLAQGTGPATGTTGGIGTNSAATVLVSPYADSSSALCNLLPALGSSKEMVSSAGIYVGEGLLPVPAKLAENIKRWEFTDMAELLPEFWTSSSAKEVAMSGPPVQRYPTGSER